MKPRVMSLVVFTALVGLIISNKQVDFLTSALALFFVALGAGAAGALNMWYDSEAAMSRLWGGIHYMPAIVNGSKQGSNLGSFIVKTLKTQK